MKYQIQKQVTLYFAIVFFLLFVLAYIPGLYTNTADGQLLLNLVLVNPAQTYIHLLTGLAALVAFYAGQYYSTWYLKVFGAVYALVALWGLPGLAGVYDGVLFNLIHVNLLTEVYHIAVAAVALYFGFTVKKSA